MAAINSKLQNAFLIHCFADIILSKPCADVYPQKSFINAVYVSDVDSWSPFCSCSCVSMPSFNCLMSSL